jgi:hypothetical protein
MAKVLMQVPLDGQLARVEFEGKKYFLINGMGAFIVLDSWYKSVTSRIETAVVDTYLEWLVELENKDRA